MPFGEHHSPTEGSNLEETAFYCHLKHWVGKRMTGNLDTDKRTCKSFAFFRDKHLSQLGSWVVQDKTGNISKFDKN